MRTHFRNSAFLWGIFLLLVQTVPAQEMTAKLKSRIFAELGRYYEAPFKIAVSEPGVVTISGEAQSYWDKLNVFAIVARVPGVREISNQLVVQADLVADDVIKADIENALNLNNAIIEPQKIRVAVDHGLVILRGTVSFRREAEAAEDIAAWHHGVKSVDNEITVLPPKQAISDQNLLAILQETVERFFPLEKHAVQVRVEQGQVTLSGTVSQLWLRHQIEKEMLHIQGVRAVDNKIEIMRES